MLSNSISELKNNDKMTKQDWFLYDISHSLLPWLVLLLLTKNKRPYLLVTATGLDGKNFRMFCWGWDGETELPLYSLCCAEVKKNDFGYQTSMSKVKLLRI